EYSLLAGWILVGASVVARLLFVYVIAKIWNRAFWQEPGQEMFDNERPTPKVMSGATAAMIAFSLVLTVAAGPIRTYADEAAQSVLERTPYVGAVLDDEDAGDMVYRIDEEG